MTNSNLFLALGSSKKNFTSSANKKTSRTPIPTNITTSYRNILQENLANFSRPPVRNTNNFSSTNSQVVRGDANDDGIVDKNDLDLLQRHLVELSSVKNFNAADMNGDGKITVTDVSQLSLMLREQQSKNNSVLKGDVNSDGKINVKDTDLIELRLANLGDDSKIDMNAADMNDDGEITHADWFKVNQLVEENESSIKTLQGDSNGDGVVNEADHKNIEDYLSGKESSEDFIRKNSDINGDGEVDKADLQGVQNILNGRPVDWDESRLGDANGDGKINVKDAELIHLRLLGLGQNHKFDINYADFNNDGKITGVDMARISQLVRKYEDSVKTLRGDSNGDGVVNEIDHQNIKNYLSGRESSEDFISKNSDVNSDGEVDEQDLQGVRNILDGRKIDWDESRRRLGDVNGDGKIDTIEDAVTIINYVNGKIQKNDFYWDNADVNHDGKIDLEDAVRIKKFYNGEISSLDQKISKIAPPYEQAVMTKDSDVYFDLNLITAGDPVSEGLRVNVIGMSSDGTALEIEIPISGGYKRTGWVSTENVKKYEPSIPKITLLEPEQLVEPSVPKITILEPEQHITTDKQIFTAARRVETYETADLSTKVNSYEFIPAGGQFFILEETDNAYKIQYNSTRDGLKDRWVSKDILLPNPEPQPQPLQPFMPYATNVSFDLDTYGESSMNKKIGRVFKGERVTVLSETENALQIRYGVGTAPNYTDFKTGWIPKNVPVPNPEPQTEPIQSINSLIPVPYQLDTNPDDLYAVLLDDAGYNSKSLHPTSTPVKDEDSLNIFEYTSDQHKVIKKIFKALGQDVSDLKGFQFVDNAFAINGLLKSGTNCILEMVDGDTGKSTYYFADLTFKVISLVQPEVAFAWAALQATIETAEYEKNKEEFKTLAGFLMEATDLDTNIVTTATFINKLFPILEMSLGKDYAQDLVQTTESLLNKGIEFAVSSLGNWFSSLNLSQSAASSASGGKVLDIPMNPFIGPVPTRK